ncbi:MAG: TVP38/TMEM64 family protein [Neisseriaceae bacterium]
MNNFSILLKTMIVLIITILAIVLFKYFNLHYYLSVAGINDYSHQIVQFSTSHPYHFIIGYFLLYFVLITCCIPGTVILDIIAGFLFGIFWGTTLIVISYTISICGNYFVVHYLFHDFFIKRLKKIKISHLGKDQKQIFINLTALRLIPIIPFWTLNILASIFRMRFGLFILSTIVGIFPIAIIYTIIGDSARDALLSHEVLNISVLMAPKVWILLGLLALIIMLPGIVKSINRNFDKH